MRRVKENTIFNQKILNSYGLSNQSLIQTIEHTYHVIDAIDRNLLDANISRFSKLVELANLSAMIGNLFRSGIIKFSNNLFQENKPHTFPDLISTNNNYPDLEIKVALETNKPKGHLVKPGSHIVIRYCLGNEDGSFLKGKTNRGEVAWIWQVCIGELMEEHFNISNTDGDSGKTAVINQKGMDNLQTVYFDQRVFPYSREGGTYKKFSRYFKNL